MILLTSAPNDSDLIKPLGGLAIVTSIPYGDVNFLGKWEDNKDIWVCGERKHLGDLIQCINDGRHIHQIQMAREAGFEHYFFILEADYRNNRTTGIIQERKGKDYKDHESAMGYKRLKSYLHELQWYADVRVYHTKSPIQTAEIIKEIYFLFQESPEQHNSLKKIYHTPLPSTSVLLNKRPSLRRRVAAELPDVGYELSGRLESRFGSTRELINASEEELVEVEGIGEKTARKIIERVNNE